MIDLYNDSCLNILDSLVNKNINIDTIIVDPPYNISYNDFDWDKNFDIEKAIFLCSKLLKVNGNFFNVSGLVKCM